MSFLELSSFLYTYDLYYIYSNPYNPPQILYIYQKNLKNLLVRSWTLRILIRFQIRISNTQYGQKLVMSVQGVEHVHTSVLHVRVLMLLMRQINTIIEDVALEYGIHVNPVNIHFIPVVIIRVTVVLKGAETEYCINLAIIPKIMI